MAYNGNGYGQSNPYAHPQQGSNFDQPPPQYGGQGYGYGERQHDVEMQPLTGGAAPYEQAATPVPQQRDPNAILNDCRTVGRAIDDLEGRLQELQRLQRAFISGTGSNKEIDALSADIMTGYRGLADRVRRIKSQPEAGSPRNRPQVDALDRRIRKAINAFQQQESAFRKEVTDQQRRQYLIVRPDATEAELREATQDGGDMQVFQQALLSADRRGQGQSALRNVQQRHDAIQKIERTLMELQQLFQDLDQIVVQQEPMIQNIEHKAEETKQHMEAGNVHVDRAVTSARAARRKKWICLGISILIIIIVIAIVLGVGASLHWFGGGSGGKP